MARKPSESVQLKLRFSERLRMRIEQAAKKNDQSLNSEIVRRLEQSFERDDRAALIQQVEATVTASATTTATLVISELSNYLASREDAPEEPKQPGEKKS